MVLKKKQKHKDTTFLQLPKLGWCHPYPTPFSGPMWLWKLHLDSTPPGLVAFGTDQHHQGHQEVGGHQDPKNKKHFPGDSLWPFWGWLSDPFKWLSDLQLGDEKVTNWITWLGWFLGFLGPDLTFLWDLDFWSWRNYANKNHVWYMICICILYKCTSFHYVWLEPEC